MLRSPQKFSKKTKDQLRKKFLSIRKKKYFEVSENRLNSLTTYIKKKYKVKKQIFVALYYPSNYELNLLNIFKKMRESKIITLLPIVKKNYSLVFTPWTNKEILIVNKYGIPEPQNKNKKNYLPDIVLVPLLAFDEYKNRLGYGKGYYDRYLANLFKSNKKIETIGVAFSFQKFKKLPTTNHDFKLNKIFTEKGFC